MGLWELLLVRVIQSHVEQNFDLIRLLQKLELQLFERINVVLFHINYRPLGFERFLVKPDNIGGSELCFEFLVGEDIGSLYFLLETLCLEQVPFERRLELEELNVIQQHVVDLSSGFRFLAFLLLLFLDHVLGVVQAHHQLIELGNYL